MKNAITLITILSSLSVLGQIKIGDNPNTINSNSILEIESTNKGLLLPRVALNATTSSAPLSTHTAGMTIFNTATTGDVSPGYYYNDGTSWIRIGSSKDEPWYGADDNGPATSNTEDIYTMGKVGIGINNPQGALHIHTDDSKDVIYSRSNDNANNDLDIDIIRTRGTAASPSLPLDGDRIGGLRFKSLTGSADVFDVNGEISVEADGTISPTSSPGKMIFFTTPDGSRTPLERMTILNNGNIGIGISTPSTILDINGTTKTTNIQITSGATAGHVLQSDASGNATWVNPNTLTVSGDNLGNHTATQNIAMGSNTIQFGNITGEKINLYSNRYGIEIQSSELRNKSGAHTTWGTHNGTAFTERMRLNNVGNLGIGTTSPGTRLHLTSTTDPIANFQTSDDSWLYTQWLQNNGTRRTWMGLNSDLSEFHINGENGTSELIFGGVDVGIGTTAPAALLDIVGAISPTSGGLRVAHNNATQGISIGYNSLSAIGTNSNQHLNLIPKGTGGVGIGTTTPSRKLEVNSGALNTPSIRITQQTANQNATSTTGNTTKSLVVDANGDVRTKINEKRYSRNTCGCATGTFPYTLPSDLTTYEQYDGNWSGNGAGNTTLPDFILPTVANAIAAGHKYGDIVVIHRGSGYNTVIGTTNTNLGAPLAIPGNTSVGFSLGLNRWYRVF